MPKSKIWGQGSVFVDTPLSRTLNKLTAGARFFLFAIAAFGAYEIVGSLRNRDHALYAEKRRLTDVQLVRQFDMLHMLCVI